MKVIVLENGDITIVDGVWIILRWRKDKNRIIRVKNPTQWWQEAVALLEQTKKARK